LFLHLSDLFILFFNLGFDGIHLLLALVLLPDAGPELSTWLSQGKEKWFSGKPWLAWVDLVNPF
jgi:hypothetical protein